MDITAAIIADFRDLYPQFPIATYPDAQITFALCEGDSETGGKGWGSYVDDCHNFKQRGMFLYAAHWLTSSFPNGTTTGDNASSQAAFPSNSKSVGDESIGYDTGKATELTAGDAWLATTSYGQQWLRLRRRAGMGARAV